jgi:hypothetical protein
LCAHTRSTRPTVWNFGVGSFRSPLSLSTLGWTPARVTGGQGWRALSLRTECPFTRSTRLDQEGCGGRGNPASGLSLRPWLLGWACRLSRWAERAPPALSWRERWGACRVSLANRCRRCYGLWCLLRPGVCSNHARHVGLSRFALGDSLRRPFVEQAELGTEFFSGQGCRPVGFAFDGVLGGRVATECRWALGCAGRRGGSQRSTVLSGSRREVRSLPYRALGGPWNEVSFAVGHP